MRFANDEFAPLRKGIGTEFEVPLYIPARREKNVRTIFAEQHLVTQNRKTLHSTSYNDVSSFLMLFDRDPKVCPQTHLVNQCFELYSRMRQG